MTRNFFLISLGLSVRIKICANKSNFHWNLVTLNDMDLPLALPKISDFLFKLLNYFGKFTACFGMGVVIF